MIDRIHRLDVLVIYFLSLDCSIEKHVCFPKNGQNVF